MVEAGANQMHGIAFRVDQADALLAEARKRAIADARKKAELYAEHAGLSVGLPITIREDDGAAPHPPMVGFRAGAAMPGGVPIAAGEQELSVTVYVVYEANRAK